MIAKTWGKRLTLAPIKFSAHVGWSLPHRIFIDRNADLLDMIVVLILGYSRFMNALDTVY